MAAGTARWALDAPPASRSHATDIKAARDRPAAVRFCENLAVAILPAVSSAAIFSARKDGKKHRRIFVANVEG